MKLLKKIQRTLDEIDELFGVAETTLWTPIPESPQELAYHSEAQELLFGGMAGGGKTDLIVGLALTAHKRTLVLRRHSTDLSAMQARFRDITGAIGSLAMKIGNDRLVEFGGCKDDSSKFKYKGQAHDLKAFDELSEWKQQDYEYISAWNRTSDPDQRCRIIATTNPPDTNDGKWIIERWAAWLDPSHPNPAKSGEIRWFLGNKEVENNDPVDGQIPRSRTFVRASVHDNPYLLATGYDHLLDNLPEGLREKLRDGDFTLSMDDAPRQLIPSGWIKEAQARWTALEHEPLPPLSTIGCDPARGGKDRTVVSTKNGAIVNYQQYPGKQTPDGSAVAQIVLQFWQPGIPINLDVIGIGSSVVDYLKDSKHPVVPVNFSKRSVKRDRSGLLKFANIRTEVFWNLRDALDPHYNPTLALPPDPIVLTELSAFGYRLKHGGFVQVDSTEEITAKIGKSPDIAMAIALCAYESPRYVSSF